MPRPKPRPRRERKKVAPKRAQKEARNFRNPVKVLFLCELEGLTSKIYSNAFLEFLRENKLDWVSSASGSAFFAGKAKGPIEGHDFVVVLGRDLAEGLRFEGAEVLVVQKDERQQKILFRKLLGKIMARFKGEALS